MKTSVFCPLRNSWPRPVWLAVVLLLAGSSGTGAQSVSPLASCTPPDCSDGNACTIDTCDTDLLECVHTPVDCNDNNPCTADSCDPALGCRHAPADGLACDDHRSDTCNDHCQAGSCVGGVSCDDGNVCTVDTCDQTLGCRYTAAPDGQSCDDQSPVTCFDHCQAGSCVGDRLCDCPTNCDDGNPCTVDGCDLQGNCAHTPKDCYDTNPCSYDYCDLSSGQCVHDWVAMERLGCSSGGCTVGGECLVGQCYGGQPRNCDDNNACTGDSCNPGSGCVHVPTKDSDFDTHVDAACGGNDCDDNDPGAWHAVSEVVNLQAGNPSPTSITWDSQAVAAGPGTTYDVASGLIPTLGAGYLSPACLSSAGAAASYDDGRPAPPLNQLYWYLVRAHNSCGTGDYGKGSNGAPRSIPACP